MYRHLVNRVRLLEVVEGAVAHFLSGHTILVAEDEALIALDLEATLCSAGAEVIAAPDLEMGLEAAHHASVSAAVIDVKLCGLDCAPICRVLTQRQLPFIFHTGYRLGGALDAWPRVSVLVKPATRQQLLDCLAGAILEHQPRRRYC
jgi:CheY-like chemotaxis protein